MEETDDKQRGRKEIEDMDLSTDDKKSSVQGRVMATACLRAIPTWLLTNLASRFFLPKDHIWHKRRFGLDDWQRGQTKTCKIFDYIFWINGILIASVVIRLWL